jgi:acyl transferase domain-containing protein/acyl carrier protein
MATNFEPIAIIGIGCRFPGAKDPDAFWQLLRNGVNAITEVPPDRWDINAFYDPDPAMPDKMNTRWGGFLDQVDQFDPQFFGIAPREAVSMDPKQRLLLEVSWEALEDAGRIPDHLAGSPIGVFIGISSYDYYELLMRNPRNVDGYAATGNNNCIAAHRISYVFDFTGPSMAIDTACSSSLVAVHLACQSLWSGESSMALAGGVQIMLSPWVTVSFSKGGFMADDGLCKVFDARANGYVRGEGAGMVVLKPLSQAIADGDAIYAVIRGSAINQDGRSNGLTAPNPQSQEAVLRSAYRRSGISPEQVSYIEVHGTGTKLGDPMELKALGKVLTQNRDPGDYCAVGSVKSNIGHLEAAAGIAGLIKVALSLKHCQIPPSLHFQQPNPYINFEKLRLWVQGRLAPWTAGNGCPLAAGVSSFGFGGTNAHVVLEAAPDSRAGDGPEQLGFKRQNPAAMERPWHVLTLSAKSEAALRSLAQQYQEFLAHHPQTAIADICFTANTRRSQFEHRLAVVAGSTKHLQERLAAVGSGSPTEGLVSHVCRSRKPPKLGFLFTGQGSQYVEMGRQLYETQPIFRQTLDECTAILGPYLETPLLEVLYPNSQIHNSQFNSPSHSPLLNAIAYTQPALFAIEYTLVQVWKSWGIEPDIVMGHNLGEYVAACVAGVFSLEDGLKLIAARGRLMQNLPQAAEMVVKFHSPLMQPMLAEFEQVAATVTYSPAKISLVSHVTGQLATEDIATPDYWSRHLLRSGKFASSMETLAQLGYEVFVEIGTQPTLLEMGQQCLESGAGVWLPSLRPGKDDWQQMLQSLAELHIRGVQVDWFGFDREYARRPLKVPTYPFQRQRYWIETTDSSPHTAEPALPEKVQTSAAELYEIQWQPKTHQQNLDITATLASELSSWLIFADPGGIGDALIELLHSQRQTCFVVYPGDAYACQHPRVYNVNPVDPDDFQQLLRDVDLINAPPLKGVIHLWSVGLEQTPEVNLCALEQVQILGCASTLHLVQALVKRNGSVLPRLWLVTQGAQFVESQPSSPAVAQAPLWGLGKVIALEHPQLWGGLCDLALDATQPDAARMLLTEIYAAEGEDQIAWRSGHRYGARLVNKGELPAAAVPLRPDATYLITGGLGALGLRVARWMVEQGVRHLILLSRRPASAPTQAEIVALGQGEAQILVTQADVSNYTEMLRVFEGINASMPPMKGIIHAAGVLEDGILLQQDWERFTKVMNPKIQGAWNLHTLTQHLPLDFFVCFSSVSSLLGAAGQSNYAAANAFLDSLAHYRHRQGLPGLSLNWGQWTDTGMAANLDDRYQNRLAVLGMNRLSWEQGLQGLANLLGQRGIAQMGVFSVDWSRLKQQVTADQKLPLLAHLLNEVASPEENASAQQHTILQELEAVPDYDRQPMLTAYIQQEVAKIMGLRSPHLPDPQQGFFDMGMDSLMVLELKNLLDTHLGTSLPATLTFEFATIQDLVEHLLNDILQREATVSADPVQLAAAEPQPRIVPSGSDITQLPKAKTKPTARSRVDVLIEEDIDASITERLEKLEKLLR